MILKNTLTNEKEVVTLKKQIVIYLCGPTVYSSVHIGNLRPVIATDLLVNILRYQGYEVKLIHNITDINEKIIFYANKINKTEKETANLFTNNYLKLLKKIMINYPNKIIKVTDSLNIINKYIYELDKANYLYSIDNDGIYVDVSKDKKYGILSNRNTDDQINKLDKQNKKNHYDFCVWKKGIDGMQFPSKFGEGRPGWHTECVAIIDSLSNKKAIDFHIGGTDLIFPHHENEICQQRLLRNNNLARFWLHIGQLNIDGKKMAKSIGNIIDSEKLATDYNINTIKYIIHSNIYSKPLNVTQALIEDAYNKVTRFKKTHKLISKYNNNDKISDTILKSLLNNMNTPIIIAYLNKATKQINNLISNNNILEIKKIANDYCNILKMLGFCY